MSHWYKPNPDGTITTHHDSDLRDARKMGLYCSITTIEKAIRVNPGLTRWIEGEIIKATIAYPKMEWEDLKAYVDRIKKASGKIAETAADFGTRLHDALQHFPQYPMDLQIIPYFEKYAAWHDANIVEIIGSELVLANDQIAVAGTLDKVVRHKTHGLLVIDYKSQDVKAKPAFYSSWARQLSFYAKTWAKKNCCETPRLMSLIVDSNEPKAPIAQLWSDEDAEKAWKETVAHAWLWAAERDFWANGPWEIADVLNETVDFQNDIPV